MWTRSTLWDALEEHKEIKQLRQEKEQLMKYIEDLEHQLHGLRRALKSNNALKVLMSEARKKVLEEKLETSQWDLRFLKVKYRYEVESIRTTSTQLYYGLMEELCIDNYL